MIRAFRRPFKTRVSLTHFKDAWRFTSLHVTCEERETPIPELGGAVETLPRESRSPSHYLRSLPLSLVRSIQASSSSYAVFRNPNLTTPKGEVFVACWYYLSSFLLFSSN